MRWHWNKGHDQVDTMLIRRAQVAAARTLLCGLAGGVQVVARGLGACSQAGLCERH